MSHEPTVRLLSATSDPIVTIFQCWESSRHNDPVQDAVDIRRRMEVEPDFRKKVEDTFMQVLDAGIPVAENVNFTFLIEGMSIALREQMVRHRIGHHFGDRLGCDIVPDLADSTFWAQSMRILDMGGFARQGRFHIPESMRDQPKEPMRNCKHCQGKGSYEDEHPHNGSRLSMPCDCWKQQYKGKFVLEHGQQVTVETFWRRQMMWIESAYKKLVEAGIPMEDARGLIPLDATHRMTWTTNLAALKHVMGKRGCWILQLGIWKPIIVGIVEELASNFGPVFRQLISPPCVKSGRFTGCQFKLDNTRRILGEDEIPPCDLYLNKHAQEAIAVVEQTAELTIEGAPKTAWHRVYSRSNIGEVWGPNPATLSPEEVKRRQERMDHMRSEYSKLWNRSTKTGETLQEPIQNKSGAD